MQLGVVHYLVKPFGYGALRERLTPTAACAPVCQESPRRLPGRRRRCPTCSAGPVRSGVDRTRAGLRADTQLVRNAVAAAHGDISAADVGEITGMSRATAQRYLTYLDDTALFVCICDTAPLAGHSTVTRP